MNRVVKGILFSVALLLLVALIGGTVVFFIPRDNTSFSFECFRVRLAVSGFLKDLEKGRYDKAVDFVYFVSSEDGSAVASDETVRSAWVERVSSLKQGTANTYLDGYENLSVRKENGKILVTVFLSVQRQGTKDPFYNDGNSVSVIYQDGWKISSVSDYSFALQTDFERAVSGVVTALERGEQAS